MSNCCDTTHDHCKTTPCGDTTCCESESNCPTEASCPVDHMAGMWKDSFFDAMKEAQVETLKAKILKAWGPVIDKEADALIEAMGAKWEAMIAQVKAAEACNDFKGKIRDLWLAEKK